MLFILLVLVSLHNSFAQNPTTVIRQTTVTNLRPENYANEFSITDANGRPFKELDADVQGSAYFIDSVMSTVITFTNGNSFQRIPARLDLYRQEIHVVSKNKEEFILPKELVKELIFTDSNSTKFKQYVFRAGFPAIDDQNGSSFYLVLASGKISMLEFFRKKILQRKDDISGVITKEFETYEDYYVFQDNQMVKLKKDKSFIVSMMKDKEKEIQSYLSTNNVNFKKWNDVQSLFSYYNSLVK